MSPLDGAREGSFIVLTLMDLALFMYSWMVRTVPQAPQSTPCWFHSLCGQTSMRWSASTAWQSLRASKTPQHFILIAMMSDGRPIMFTTGLRIGLDTTHIGKDRKHCANSKDEEAHPMVNRSS